MMYYVKYWITVRQENPDVKSFVVCGNLLSAPYLVKINTVRGVADRPSLRFEGLGWYNSKDCIRIMFSKDAEICNYVKVDCSHTCGALLDPKFALNHAISLCC